MTRLKDLTGQKFGKLTVIKRANNHKMPSGQTKTMWLCKCDCGNEVEIMYEHIVSSHTTSCGCKGGKFKDLTGKRFGRLVVNCDAGRTKNKSIIWHCICDCGNEINVRSFSLLSGKTQSCGCYSREKISERSLKDLTGQKFGKLIVLKRVENYIQPSGQIKTVWLCKCDCGNETNVHASSLLSGNTQSCGCQVESLIASELKKYLYEIYNAQIEYRILKNPDTGYYLPYDIYIFGGKIPEINGIYIEINGRQHYSVHRWNELQAKENGATSVQEFEYQKYRDELKKKFARENGHYIEIDLRKIETIERAIEYTEGIILKKTENIYE